MNDLVVVCVKIGTKYSSEMVNNLYRMCRKNITIPFEFFCYTDDSSKLLSHINVIPYVEHGLDIIVYNKLFLFSDQVDKVLPSCRRVYFDLDLVIKTNIDDIVKCKNGDLTLIDADWRKKYDYGFPLFHHPFNSSCMVWESPQTRGLWEHFIKNPEFFMNKYHWGMDSFMFYEMNNAGVRIDYFPYRKFYSFMFGVDYAENLLHDPLDPAYRESKFLGAIQKIPVVLFNGPVDESHYWKFYQKYYGV